MNTVTISRKEYQELKDKKDRYERLQRVIAEDLFSPPPTRSRRAVMRVFRKTKQYNPAFLESFEKGLKRSSYFRA